MSLLKYLFFYPERQGNQFSKGLMLGALIILIPFTCALIRNEGNCIKLPTLTICKEP